ncbi:MAG: endopeptidase La [Candidatus Schekmanbacteria bacterium]|nr:MAG: endopeptidase La [Candidatus Schekmanbacteria bacterium]
MKFLKFFSKKNYSSNLRGNKKPKFPKELSLLPLRNSVMFPNTATSIVVGREKTLKQINDAEKNREIIGVVAQKDETIENPTYEDIYKVGTASSILRISRLSENNITVTIQGLKRFKIKRIIREEPYFTALVEYIDEKENKDVETDALFLGLKDLASKAASLSKNIPGELVQMIQSISSPATLADLVASNLTISVKEKQKLLETFDIKTRLRLVSLHINRELQALEIAEKIRSDVVGNVTKAQREFYLKEQLKAIKKELGESDEDNDIAELEKKIKDAEMPEEALQEAKKELNRLSKMHPSSAEYTVSRTYIEWLTDLPWNRYTEDNLDLDNVKQILDEDHFNLEKPKKRIIEYLAVRKLKPQKKGPILCFAGPPGVGKTSLGRSIARALGRKFIRVSLGGVRDEAEIRGHRKTYVGAMPGRIIQGIKRAGAKNPVFMLDEIDKLGTDFRGDPSSALLEVLDPEQNFAFSDHYLNVSFDLSQVMFIATANVLESIPPVLLDRMEVLSIPGYSEEEKTMIAKKHIIPKQIEEHGIKSDDIEFEDSAIVQIIRDYTRESGLRNLEREIATICRMTAVNKAKGENKKTVITANDIHKYLGAKKFFSETALRITRPGIATGLSWTPSGGEIIFIEASKMPGKGNLILTGQLGDVMKESAQAALTFIRSQAEIFGIDEKFYEKSEIHIHVPAGAIPKDGPSAGITIFTALLSLLTGKKVKKDIAMTGEITLRGTVLPVGGIKEKVLAAKRAGIKTIILPLLNKKDVEELPKEHIKDIEFFYIQSIDEAVGKSFEEEINLPMQKSIYV